MSRLLGKPWVRDMILGFALLCAALALMLYPRDTMEAAKSGLALCYNVIIPSLFPFFVLSSLVVELGLAGALGRLLEGIMRPLFNVGGACASAFALGFVGGYPVGAKTAIGLYEKGMCTKTEAERLLSFCNNSGPAFILGVVGAGIFASGRAGLILYLAHAAASVCVGMLFRFYRAGEDGGGSAPGSRPQFQARRFSAAFTECIKNSFFSALNICAFVVFFTVVVRLLVLTGLLPGLATLAGNLLSPLGFDRTWAERLLTGVLELTTGVWTLSGEGSLTGRLSMAAFMLGWAGISVHCQVLSFLGGSGLSVRTYLGGKFLQGLFAAGFTALLVRLFPLGAPVSSLLAEQVDDLAGLDFHTTLTLSTVSAWVTFLLFLLLTAAALRKKPVHNRSGVI
ncbi:sporulation protein [Pseudoflavonifractor sp. 524-17]|uniref:nucleoside recognition domain-containing protein n=1 Tax=Pseudoflavonifractor sp. 524-17 TaxID=2304577 RepID=UPI00137AB2E1|nr:nucleoside recognition domain-containing protein [Pseudoflavonifractor sp. 524-17]NCE63481.1 sporulation protein [Pseudoflavonifractor sp. 524-17]